MIDNLSGKMISYPKMKIREVNLNLNMNKNSPALLPTRTQLPTRVLKVSCWRRVAITCGNCDAKVNEMVDTMIPSSWGVSVMK